MYVSWLLDLPLVISWHTSLHEYAGTRLQKLLHFSGKTVSGIAGAVAERLSVEVLRQFYRRAVVTDPALHVRMREAAREYALQQSWDTVFESVFKVYAEGIQLYAARRPVCSPLLSSRVHGRSSS
jgi:hypothetical protein